MSKEYEIKVIRIAIFGDSISGKTSIFNSFFGYEFNDDRALTNWDKNNKNIEMDDGKELTLVIQDTAGQERFHSICLKVCKRVQGILLCFDLTYRETFDNITKWFDEINEIYKDKYKNIPIVLLGNKCDMISKRVITEKEAKELAKKLSLRYYEVSAKTKTNIEKAILFLANIVYKNIKEIQSKNKNDFSVNKHKKDLNDKAFNIHKLLKFYAY